MSQGVKRKRTVSKSASRKKNNIGSVTKDQPRPVVRADALAWHEISVNQHLEDAEGFFGLEEIDDVEVIKDESGKSVLFRPSKTEDVKEAANGHESGEAEEWSGFNDSDDGGENGTVDFKASKQDEASLTGSANHPDVLSDVNFAILHGTTPDAEIDTSAWSDLGMSSEILSALSHMGFSTPTSIQQIAIPEILGGKDVIGKAVTGSGKTLAFGIPVVEKFLELGKSSADPGCLALILAPTRELAHQISKHLAGLCATLSRRPRITTVTGGLSVLKQQRQLERANIVVGTPGRLWEVISGSSDMLDKFRELHFLIVDEADRLLTEGHFNEVEDILDALDKVTIEEDDITPSKHEHEHEHSHTRQTLVFSATFHKGLQQKLASKRKDRRKNSDLLNDKQSMEYLMHKLPFQDGHKPTFVDASPDSQLAEKLTETIIECGAMQKDLYLYTCLLQEQHKRMLVSRQADGGASISRILVFTNSVSAVKRLVPFLQTLNLPHTTVAPLQSNMAQKARLRSLERFSETPAGGTQATTTILVATDVAARGLDIPGITTIIHYHVPRTADAYVHRSGRTARINNTGRSILLCSPEETASVTKLIAQLHARTDKPTNDIGKVLDRMYLSTALIRQVEKRVELAQKIVDASQSSDKVNSQDNWLRKAAEDLGVDYDSEEFEAADRQHRRGRGGGKERKQKQAVEDGEKKKNQLGEWRAELKDDLQKRLDFGDGMSGNMRYLAGGSLDVDRLLAERVDRSR